MNIFDFDSYISYISKKIDFHNKKRGYQSELARAAKCQTSYFSAVLQGKVFLTPDQASALCDFWSLTDAESEYFLGLVIYARAGSPSLKKRISKKLALLRDRGREVGSAIEILEGDSVPLSSEDRSFFHKNWLCAAVYGAARIDALKTTEEIARYLNISHDVLSIVVNRLEKMGLLQWNGDRWTTIDNTVLAKNLTDHILFHHSLQERARFKNLVNQSNDFCYSFLGTCSLKAFEEVKIMIREVMNAQMKLLNAEQKEETVVGFCYDVFQV